ncbi:MULTISPECIES: hypothetical protein, partial [unclassified Neisseria]|uniref:hypothetical protein n=1 Tax=unclassified Neisseria TaxID=2623750 RepID=UPI00266703D4
KMYLGKGNLIYINGIDSSRSYYGADVEFVSTNWGKSWRKEDNGSNVYGGYFNPQTNEAWMLKIYSLYSRTVK